VLYTNGIDETGGMMNDGEVAEREEDEMRGVCGPPGANKLGWNCTIGMLKRARMAGVMR
jgi:hypothetical protein